MTALCITTAALLVAFAAWGDWHWMKRHPKQITRTELLVGLSRFATRNGIRSILDENGRRVWDEQWGDFLPVADTWKTDSNAELGKVAAIDKRTGT